MENGAQVSTNKVTERYQNKCRTSRDEDVRDSSFLEIVILNNYVVMYLCGVVI
jgi:hypothetical protein